jgi:integrase
MADPFRKHGHWYIKLKDSSGIWRVHRTTAQNKAEARLLLAEMEAKINRQSLGLEAAPSDCTLTFGELCEWWLKERCPEVSRRKETSRLQKHVIRKGIAKLAVPRVTSALVDERMREMEKAGAAPASVNKLRAILHSVFEQASKADLYTGTNPLDRVSARRVTKRVHTTLALEEVPTVLAHVPLDWRGFFATAIYMALRKGEICGLLKRDVDLKREELVVAHSYDRDTTKGGHADVLPIPQPLKPYLVDALDRSASKWVFPCTDGAMRTDDCDPQKILRTALKVAGMVEGYDHTCRRCMARGAEEAKYLQRHPDAALRCCQVCGMKLWPKAVPRDMVFHDLRHTTATLLLRAGVNAHHVQRILRHASINTTTSVYGHLQTDDLRKGLATVFGSEPAREIEAPGSFGPPVVRTPGPEKDSGPDSTRKGLKSGPELEWELQGLNLGKPRHSRRFRVPL